MTLIENCRSWWKLWSVRIHGGMSLAVAELLSLSHAAEQALPALPPTIQQGLPWVIGIAVFALGTWARLTPQPKVAADAPTN